MDHGFFFFKTSLLAISYVYVGFERHDKSLSLPRWRRQLRQRSEILMKPFKLPACFYKEKQIHL